MLSDEAKRLYDMGFAILWLKPKSKMPVGLGWTKPKRKSWAELKSAYRPGYNMGVLLGQASEIEGYGYLACIDVDIKNPAYRKDALAKLKEITGGWPAPEVRSGSGNGSRHLYGVTIAPFKMITVEKNKNWEICIYSTGRQMVLPPSIHPDTGKAYVWQVPLMDTADLPFIPIGEYAEAEPPKTVQDFKAVEVDLRAKGLPRSTIALIETGNDGECTDRSAALFTVCMAMAKHGYSNDEILSALTDRENFLGETAYDHAVTSSRKRAAAWLKQYTLDRAREETSAENHFKDHVIVEADIDAYVDASADGDKIDWRESAARGFYKRGSRGGLAPEHDALLEAFKHEHPYRTIADMKAVYLFKKTHYVDSVPIEIKAFAEARFYPKPDEAIRVEFVAKVLSNNVRRRNFFTDSTEGRINFKNGVLDLNKSSETLLPHSDDYGFRGVLPYDFDPEAECPVFTEWVNGIMLDDYELVNVLQEYMGYVVRGGEYKYHKALWLGGIGRNGKSTFVDLLKALIGAGNFSVISIKALMADKFAGAALDGKIANFSEETSPQELADSGPFKNLTGDGDIFAQKKYGDPYSFRNRAKLIMTYNQIPDLKDLTAGMLSRPLIIPFQKIIAEADQDQDIKKKLFKELPGIFNFAMVGWRRLEAQGRFSTSAKSELALKHVKEESCNVYQWVDQNITISKEDDVQGDYKPLDLYAEYKRSERYPFKFIEFCRRMNAHPRVAKHKHRKGAGIYYSGLKINV